MSYIPLRFNRKPPRDYVHGPDIFNAVQKLVSSRTSETAGRIDVDLHFCAHRQCKAYVGTGRPKNAPPEACAVFRFRSEVVKIFGWLTEDDRELEGDLEYDESAFIRQMKQSGPSTVLFSGWSEYSAAEIAVAATKELHGRLFPDAGKWIVARFTAYRPWPTRLGDVEVRCDLVSNLHNRLTRTDIFLGGETAGTLNFSAIKAS